MLTSQYKQPVVHFMSFQFQPTLQFQGQGKWQPSDYGEGTERFHNQEIRKSEYKLISGKDIYGLPIKNSNAHGDWRLIRYQNGKFVEHADKQVNQKHVGTEILVLPKSLSPHEKGDLLIYNPKKKEQFICVSAQDFVYVYVFIPLGFLHEVTEVEGIRTVATRPVIDLNKKLQYFANWLATPLD